jgi:phosphatidylserine/phosphatidylglycerophosphate/cardiolipin synthase-like enzyme
MAFSLLRKIILLFLFFVLLALMDSPVLAEVEVLFSPEGAIKGRLLKEVESTTSTLELAISDMTSFDMVQALLKAKQRGVKVRIIADSKQAKMKSSQITYLIHQGIPVKVLGGKEKGSMNYRFAILDGQKVITGSYDWSGALERWHYENVLILTDSEVVAFYQREFDRLWREKRVIK